MLPIYFARDRRHPARFPGDVVRAGGRHGRTRGPLRIKWDGAQPTPTVASRLLDIPGHARSGRASPAVHPPGRQRNECAAIQPAGQRRPADLLSEHQNLASASNQRQIMLSPIAAVTVKTCKCLFLKNNVPTSHLSESTYTTKSGFLVRNG